jgi:hypothetical protein
MVVAAWSRYWGMKVDATALLRPGQNTVRLAPFAPQAACLRCYAK